MSEYESKKKFKPNPNLPTTIKIILRLAFIKPIWGTSYYLRMNKERCETRSHQVKKTPKVVNF